MKSAKSHDIPLSPTSLGEPKSQEATMADLRRSVEKALGMPPQLGEKCVGKAWEKGWVDGSSPSKIVILAIEFSKNDQKTIVYNVS